MSISRRAFLKTIGVGCSGYALTSFPPGALALNPADGLTGKATLTPSLCEMCSFRCPIQAQVIDQRTVFIQGILRQRIRAVVSAPVGGVG